MVVIVTIGLYIIYNFILNKLSTPQASAEISILTHFWRHDAHFEPAQIPMF